MDDPPPPNNQQRFCKGLKLKYLQKLRSSNDLLGHSPRQGRFGNNFGDSSMHSFELLMIMLNFMVCENL